MIFRTLQANDQIYFIWLNHSRALDDTFSRMWKGSTTLLITNTTKCNNTFVGKTDLVTYFLSYLFMEISHFKQLKFSLLPLQNINEYACQKEKT